MKKIKIIPAIEAKKAKKYFNNYLVELSQFDPTIEFDLKGEPIYKWFNNYFSDKNRYPFYLIIDNKVAGLALIRELGDKVFEIAEFYVVPSYRENGNAMWFAKTVTDLFDGEFNFSTRVNNVRAVKFWDKFVGDNKSVKCKIEDECKIWKIKL